MKVLIFGSGVLGCCYAKILSERSVDVALVARGDKARRFAQQGISLHNHITGADTTIRPRIVETPIDAPFDVVLVFVQALHIEGVLPILGSIPGVTAFCFMGNNTRGLTGAARELGKDRVLSGFGAVGGTWRDGTLVYVDRQRTTDRASEDLVLGAPFAEGAPALEQVRTFLSSVAFDVKSYVPIDDWHLTHAAMIVGLAGMLYKNDCDPENTARDTDGIKHGLLATREALRGLERSGHHIYPRSLRAILFVPIWLGSFKIRRLLRSRFAEVGLAGHAQVARQEMKSLIEDIYEEVKDQGECENLDAWRAWF